MNLPLQSDAGYRAADPYVGVRWSDAAPTPREAQTLGVLVAARAIIADAAAKLRALALPDLSGAGIEAPQDIALRLDEDIDALKHSIAHVESGEGDWPC